MVRLVLILLGCVAAAVGLSWLADRPGELVVNWQGYEFQTSVFRAIVMLLLMSGLLIVLWSLIRNIWRAPASVGHFFNRRRQRTGLDAISSGIIAIGAGDGRSATQHALTARRALPDEPLTHLLRAQAAQLSGDRVTTRRIFEAMLGAPETEVLGLRGLFLEAEREGEYEAAKQYAERAVEASPKLAWPVEALFDLQSKSGDWAGALKTLNTAKKYSHVDKQTADRRRAVLLTALAQEAEETDSQRALDRALEAHALAPSLVPAAAIAGRLLASKGNTGKVAKVIQRTWAHSPHPELAIVAAYSRPGDSPQDRMSRVAQLAAISPNAAESAIALASAAIEAKDWDRARKALKPLLDGRLTQRVATLMAKIEGEQHNDAGRVREWLARAVNAPRDPAWTADGRVSDTWQPLSPVTKTLDAFEWCVPGEHVGDRDMAALTAKLEELVSLGASPKPAASLGAPDRSADRRPSKADAADIAEVVDTFEPASASVAVHAATKQPDPAHAAHSAAAVAAKPAPSDPDIMPRTPPRPSYAASLVKPKKAPTSPRLESTPAAAAMPKAEVDALAAALATGQATKSTPSPIREATSAASAAVTSRTAEPTMTGAAKVVPRSTPQPGSSTNGASGQPVASAAAMTPKKPVAAKAGEPRVYVAPRAPDDPGTEQPVVNGGRRVSNGP